MPRHSLRQLAGWGNYPVKPCHVFRPERLAEVRQVVVEGDQPNLIARGLGRSYGDAALNENSGVMLYERMNRLLSFDTNSGILECEGGTSLHDVLSVFLPRGFFPAVTPGTKFVTVAGAIAADVHGKNHHRDGCFSEFLTDFHLLTASGDVMHCSRSENADVFWATAGGMGLTGIILTARLRLRPVRSAYLNVDYQRTKDLDQTLELFSGGDAGYQYSVAWIDCLASGDSLGRSVLMRGNHALPDDLPVRLKESPLELGEGPRKEIPFNFPRFVLCRTGVKAFNMLFYAGHRDCRRVVHYDPFFYPLDSIAHWNRMYGKRGFVQYQAVLPPENSRKGLVSMLEELARSGGASFLAVLKSFGPQNAALLSFPFAGQTLAIDLPNTGDSMRELVQRLDRIVRENGGRVYLAKDALLDPDTFNAMYPRLEQFREVKARLDPNNRFSSSLARRLGIVEGA